WFSRFMPAGFYYKTFMWPASAWPFYERIIRRAAGLGVVAQQADPDTYEQFHAACDVLVVGAGVAGIAAATAAAETGARVILADESWRAGGLADIADGTIDGAAPLAWAAEKMAALAARDNTHILTHTTVTGHYPHDHLLAVERLTDHNPDGHPPDTPRERLWKIRAKQIIIATGATERPLTFANNDRPGIMLASAARIYATRYGVSPGVRAVVFTNNDDAYRTALLLAQTGVSIPRIVDVRREPNGPLVAKARKAGIAISTGHGIADVETSAGGRAIEGVQVAALRETGRLGGLERVECDFVCVSGGWSPAAHLAAHDGGKLVYDEKLMCLLPKPASANMAVCGAANANFTLKGAVEQGYQAGEQAAKAVRGDSDAPKRPRHKFAEISEEPVEPAWFVPSIGKLSEGQKHFVDLQHDVTAADLDLAVREGYSATEHLKRYTTLGMATDQGKTGNINALGLHAQALEVSMASLGTTTFRPPYTPVTFGAIAGAQARGLFQPVRQTPLSAWHAEHGTDNEPVGQWRRPYCYGAGAISRADAVTAEINVVRNSVGLLDASTLGKIEVAGPDAPAFLDLVYSNMMSTLKPDRCRYGLMLNEEGFLFEDGVVVRLGPKHFLLHTTSGGADHVAGWLELWHQTEWPHLKVFITPVTEQWGQFALAGPNARKVLEAMQSTIDFGAAAFPYLSCKSGDLAGVPVRVFRISFTGELSFEIACPANAGPGLWQRLMKAGEEFGIRPYGTEALHVMRAEKGFIAIGDETDGSVTPHDLGLSWAVSRKKPDFIGCHGLRRKDIQRAGRRQLVGLLSDDPDRVLPDGAYAIDLAAKDTDPPHSMIGHVTSSYFSPTLGRSIALALIERGRERHGERICLPYGGETTQAQIVDPVFYDKEGARQNV
ncbi:MAG: glycine cleavage T C-terminal barrel domain-containing protein, partial [Alphaproteobacteria bacterium]